jgi:phosphoribosylanthranilate isomerase
MPYRIKICGITLYEDARAAISLGVDALGFIFYKKSPRYITPSAAADIIKKLPPFVARVGVFVDEDPKAVDDIIKKTGIDTIQLHGKELPWYCAGFACTVIKAFGIRCGFDISVLEGYRTAGYLLDTWDDTAKGGTGGTFDWSIAQAAAAKYGNVILAGGLNALNIEEALRTVRPFGVDLNSGVEIKPGVKNHYKMRDVVNIVKNFK